MTKILKVRLAGPLVGRLEAAVQSEGVTAAELVRRALALALNADRAAGGPSGGPSAARSLPSSPPIPPLSPLSNCPPALPGEPDGGEGSEPAAEAALVFPCIRDARTGRGTWTLTRVQLAEWEELFADMDVLAEARLALGWLNARGRRKTARGMPRFLFGWFSRAQNSGRYQRRPPGAVREPAAGKAKRSLLEVHGYGSWEEWEATLRRHFAAEVLDQELERLRGLRLRWENGHGD